MIGRTSGRRTVKDINRGEDQFPFKSLVDDTAARSPGRVLGDLDLDAPVVQGTKNRRAEEGVGRCEEREGIVVW